MFLPWPEYQSMLRQFQPKIRNLVRSSPERDHHLVHLSPNYCSYLFN
jgi:hypothetical protein